MAEPNSMQEHMAAVERYAAYHGRHWKQNLADHWGNETVCPPRDRADAPLLRQLRNSPNYGHEWLVKHQLRSAVLGKVLRKLSGISTGVEAVDTQILLAEQCLRKAKKLLLEREGRANG